MRSLALLAAAGTICAAPAMADIEFNGLNARQVAEFQIGTPGSYTHERNVFCYDNTTNFTGFAYANGGSAVQSGNTISRLVADDLDPAFADTGGDIPWTAFVFSVANLNQTAVTARPRVRFWNPDGAGGAPGTYFNDGEGNVGFTFNPITFNANSVGLFIADITSFGVEMPTQGSFWFGVTFDNNVGGTGATQAQIDNLGQGIFDPPTIGSSLDQAFSTTGAGSFFGTNNPAGSLFNFGGDPIANFGLGIEVLPTPGAAGLLGLAALAAARRRR